MKVTYDFEFLEDGRTIEPISAAFVREDGKYIYLVNRDMPVRRIRKNPFLMNEVMPNLPQGHGDWRLHMPTRWLFDYRDPRVVPLDTFRSLLKNFLLAQEDLELWAWYSAYDHVAMAQLWGRMIDLPKGRVPMRTGDIAQEWARQGYPELPAQPGHGVHNALEDAQHNLIRMKSLNML